MLLHASPAAAAAGGNSFEWNTPEQQLQRQPAARPSSGVAFPSLPLNTFALQEVFPPRTDENCYVVAVVERRGKICSRERGCFISLLLLL